MSIHRQIAISLDPHTEVGALHAVEHLRRNGWRTRLFLMSATEDGGLEQAIQENTNIHGVLEFSLEQLAAQYIYEGTLAP
ncbi:MAG TPA: hypothetical protein PKD72_13175, partial [Gemmatales bacterium]|nr:hypothetical protein [Gemmatales bacterium]